MTLWYGFCRSWYPEDHPLYDVHKRAFERGIDPYNYLMMHHVEIMTTPYTPKPRYRLRPNLTFERY